MAMIKRFVFITCLYMGLGGNHFVQAYKEIRLCSGSDAEIEFGESKAIYPIFIQWFFTSVTNETTRIAKFLSIMSYDPAYKHRAVVTKNMIHLRNTKSRDSGTYIRKIRDEKNGTFMYTDAVRLKVISPPSSLPSIKIEKTEGSKEISICDAPFYKGYPEVQIVFKDNSGKIHDRLQVTENTQVYQCCLDGLATMCMDRTKPLCAAKVSEENKFKLGDCQQCFGITALSWLSVNIFILTILFFRVRCYGINIIILCKEMRRSGRLFSVVSSVLLSLSIILAILFSLCQDSISCKYRRAVFIAFGVGSTLPVFLPSMFLKLCCTRTELEQGENDMLNNDEQETDLKMYDLSFDEHRNEHLEIETLEAPQPDIFHCQEQTVLNTEQSVKDLRYVFGEHKKELLANQRVESTQANIVHSEQQNVSNLEQSKNRLKYGIPEESIGPSNEGEHLINNQNSETENQEFSDIYNENIVSVHNDEDDIISTRMGTFNT